MISDVDHSLSTILKANMDEQRWSLSYPLTLAKKEKNGLKGSDGDLRRNQPCLKLAKEGDSGGPHKRREHAGDTMSRDPKRRYNSTEDRCSER